MEKNDYWSEEIHTSYHTPAGTFTQKAPQIVQTLLDGADNDPSLALHRLLFYMNRAGSNLTDTEQLDRAKQKLEDMISDKNN